MNLITVTNTGVYVYSTFFYPKLAEFGFQGVCKWTKKINIFSKRLLLVPVHLGIHWCLASINVEERKIKYYDSLHRENPACLERLREYVIEKSSDCTSTSEWCCSTCKDVPRQLNNSDCGVFVCKVARCLANESSFDFDQCDMANIRRQMVLELLQQKLLP